MSLLDGVNRATKEAPRMSRSLMEAAGLTEEPERICPECGASMVEFDRLAEDSAVFIWYACSRENCSGQWLTKKALRMCGV